MNQSEAGFVISTRRKLRDDVAKTEARAKQRNYIEIKKRIQTTRKNMWVKLWFTGLLSGGTHH